MDQNQPKNYLVESILVTIFCCQPFGIVGIVYASQVNSKFSAGNYEGAVKASKSAKKWMTWGIVIGAITVVGFLLIYGSIFAALISEGAF